VLEIVRATLGTVMAVVVIVLVVLWAVLAAGMLWAAIAEVMPPRHGYQPTRDLPKGKPPRGGSAARRPERGPHV
jgi:hypothetical protein